MSRVSKEQALLFKSIGDEYKEFSANLDEMRKQNNLVGALVYASLSVYSMRIFFQKCFGVNDTASLERLRIEMPNASQTIDKFAERQSILADLQEKYRNAPQQGGESGGGKNDDETAVENMCYRLAELKFEKGSKECDNWFSTIIGLTDVKEDLLSMIVDPFIYKNLTEQRPKGILLYGPPGTGKLYLQYIYMYLNLILTFRKNIVGKSLC